MCRAGGAESLLSSALIGRQGNIKLMVLFAFLLTSNAFQVQASEALELDAAVRDFTVEDFPTEYVVMTQVRIGFLSLLIDARASHTKQALTL